MENIEKIILKTIIELKDSIESKNIDIFYKSLENFKFFFHKNKNILYDYLDNLNDNKELNYSKDNFKNFFIIGLGFFQESFKNIYLYQNEDIAEIYESLNYLIYIIELFKENNNNYDLFYEILSEIYDHLLLSHIESLLLNKDK